MAKSFKIQINPTFSAPVEIPRPGADPMRVTFKFKALDRVAMARCFDNWKKQGEELYSQMREDAVNDKPWTMEKLATKEIEMQAEQLEDIIEGWGFSDEFNRENLEALVGTALSVTDAIINQYHEAYTRAKRGN